MKTTGKTASKMPDDTSPISSQPSETAAFDGQFVYLAKGRPPLKPRQIGLVSGADVPLLPLDLPDALQGHAREQVATRQLCDGLGVAPEDLEIRPFPDPTSRTPRAWTNVLTADSGKVSAWRGMAGPGGRAVLPDYLALPAAPDLWVLSVTGGIVVARLGPGDGFSAAPDVALPLVQAALDNAAAAGRAPRAVYSPGPIPAPIEALIAAEDIPLARSPEALRALDIDPPQPLAHGELAFDLRRDPRAARARLARRVLPWRWPVLVGLVAAALWAGGQLVAIDRLQGQTDDIRDATLSEVRAGFVPQGPILDIRTQVGRALAQARLAAANQNDGVAPLDLVGLAASVLTAAKARPLRLDYTAEAGLTVSVRVADFAAAEALADALRDAGLAVRVLESRADGGDAGVRTELEIAPATEAAQ